MVILGLFICVLALAEGDETTVSRKRRYLLFPEGSAFQVVFDLTYPAVALQGNLITFGNTAALAWELPTTPDFFHKLLNQSYGPKMETTTIIAYDYPDIEWDRKYYFQNWHHIQRRSRRNLYKKIEVLLMAMGRDGKSCLLKSICQLNKVHHRKGTIWVEILKTIFRAKLEDQHPNLDQYDEASNSSHDCEQRYPTCTGHILSNLRF